MKKVYIPKIFFPLVAVSTEAINFCLSLVSMMFLALFVGLHFHPTLLLCLCYRSYFLFHIGIVLALAIATVYFRDLTHLVRVVLASFFYLIPIVYPMSAVPENMHFISVESIHLFHQSLQTTHFLWTSSYSS